MCPGADLAKLETLIFLHHLITKFRYVPDFSQFQTRSMHFFAELADFLHSIATHVGCEIYNEQQDNEVHKSKV